MKEFIDIFMNVVKTKYAQFSGRARRKEFWGFQLVGFVISILLAIIDGILGTSSGGIGMLQGIFALALLIPSVALIIRRLHDTDRSGWWALLCVVPLANIALVVFMFLEGTKVLIASALIPKHCLKISGRYLNRAFARFFVVQVDFC